MRNNLGRVSGPLLDRMYIQIEMPAVPFKELAADTVGPSSEELRAMVITARQAQAKLLVNCSIFCSSQMTTALTKRFCQLSPEGLHLLETAMERLKLSARAYSRIHKIARTIANLEGGQNIELLHVSEAINYRSSDRVLA